MWHQVYWKLIFLVSHGYLATLIIILPVCGIRCIVSLSFSITWLSSHCNYNFCQCVALGVLEAYFLASHGYQAIAIIILPVCCIRCIVCILFNIIWLFSHCNYNFASVWYQVYCKLIFSITWISSHCNHNFCPCVASVYYKLIF